MDDHGKLAASVSEAAEIAGVSRTLLYMEMEAGRLAWLKVRKRRLILIDDLRAWLILHRAGGR